jgi:sugar phosphate isomerase/epimerase
LTTSVTVDLGLTWDRRWSAAPDELAEAASLAGFASVGLGAELVDERTARALSARELSCHEVMALIVSDNPQATIRSAEQLAERAALIGASWVVTVFAASMNRDALALTGRCAAIINEAGSRMAVEFSPLGSVTSMKDGLEIVIDAGSERAGLLIDTWHFFSGDSTWADLSRVPVDLIAYIQFDDALAPISDDGMEETMNRRAMPGDGTFDLERFASTLLERGWNGIVSVEVLSRALSELPLSEFARRAHTSTARYWQ